MLGGFSIIQITRTHEASDNILALCTHDQMALVAELERIFSFTIFLDSPFRGNGYLFYQRLDGGIQLIDGRSLFRRMSSRLPIFVERLATQFVRLSASVLAFSELVFLFSQRLPVCRVLRNAWHQCYSSTIYQFFF